MKSAVRIMLLLVATFWWQGEARSEQGHAQPEVTRLFYVFTEGDEEHINRVGKLRQIARPWEGRLRLTGIVRTGRDRLRAGLAPATGIDKIVDAAALRTDPEIPQALFETLRGSTQFFIFAEDMSGPVTVGDQAEMMDTVTGLMSGVHPTDIQENTWGKIKVFFN